MIEILYIVVIALIIYLIVNNVCEKESYSTLSGNSRHMTRLEEDYRDNLPLTRHVFGITHGEQEKTAIEAAINRDIVSGVELDYNRWLKITG